MTPKKMNLFAALVILLSLFVTTSAQTNQARVATTSTQDTQIINITRNSSPPPQMVAVENFTGFVGIEPLFQANEPSRLAGFRVTFAPGARTAWHTHPAGQTLIVTAGVGLVQQWGSPTQEIRPGDVVRIPPGQKHWHGASANNAMTHIALLEQLNGKTVDWMEKVSDAQYNPPAAPAVPKRKPKHLPKQLPLRQ